MTVSTTYSEVSPVLTWFKGLGVCDADDLNPVLLAFSDSAEIYGSPNYPYGFLRSDEFGLKYFRHDGYADGTLSWQTYDFDFVQTGIYKFGDDGLIFYGYNQLCYLQLDDLPMALFTVESTSIQICRDSPPPTIFPLPRNRGIYAEFKRWSIVIWDKHRVQTTMFEDESICLCIDITDNSITFLTQTYVIRWTVIFGGRIIFSENPVPPELRIVDAALVTDNKISMLHTEADGSKSEMIYTYNTDLNTVTLVDKRKTPVVSDEYLYLWVPNASIGMAYSTLGDISFYLGSTVVGRYITFDGDPQWEWVDYRLSIVTTGGIAKNEKGLPCLKRIKLYLNSK